LGRNREVRKGGWNDGGKRSPVTRRKSKEKGLPICEVVGRKSNPKTNKRSDWASKGEASVFSKGGGGDACVLRKAVSLPQEKGQKGWTNNKASLGERLSDGTGKAYGET